MPALVRVGPGRSRFTFRVDTSFFGEIFVRDELESEPQYGDSPHVVQRFANLKENVVDVTKEESIGDRPIRGKNRVLRSGGSSKN